MSVLGYKLKDKGVTEMVFTDSLLPFLHQEPIVEHKRIGYSNIKHVVEKGFLIPGGSSKAAVVSQ